MPSFGAAAALPAASNKIRPTAITDTLRIPIVPAIGLLVEEGQRRLVCIVVASNQDAPVRGQAKPCSAPVCGHASGSLDDRNHRAKIVGLEAGFKDEIDKPRGQQAVCIAIGAIARELYPRRNSDKGCGIQPAEHLWR